MEDGSDNSFYESLSLGEVVVSEGSRSDSVDTVSFVDALGVTLSLGYCYYPLPLRTLPIVQN